MAGWLAEIVLGKGANLEHASGVVREAQIWRFVIGFLRK